MDDFTISVTNLPMDYMYNNDLNLLSASLH